MTAIDAQSVVRYEGGSAGTEIWGMTQADFLVVVPGHHAKEAAVNLTNAASAWLAKELGTADSTEFRIETARRIGTAFLSKVVANGLAIESITIVSEGFLEVRPELVAALRVPEPAA